MVEKVRAKFAVESKSAGDSGSVLMRAVYSTDPNHENKKFWDATPSGEVSMWIQNPQAFEFFNIGDEVYIDFTLAPKDLDVSNCAACGQYHVRLKRDENGNVTCPTTQELLTISDV